MKLLIIDTSTEKSFICFSDGTNVLLNLPLPAGFQSSRFVMPAISSGLEQLKIKIRDLKALAVTVGPGSFTGTRVGVAVAKALAFGCDLPLIALSSLSGFISQEEGPFISLIDARSNGAYILLQERQEQKIIEHSAPRFVGLAELKEILLRYKRVVGPSFERLAIPEARETCPDAGHLTKIAYKKFLEKKFETDIQLIYLKNPEVERYSSGC